MKTLLLKWLNDKADKIMGSRPPDFIIGNDYLHRWWVIPRNRFFNIYLHKIYHGDDDRALHDHPWVNMSALIKGSYLEITPKGTYTRQTGKLICRMGSALHRLEMNGGPCTTFFITGPCYRKWGFACPKGWKYWEDFVDPNNKGQPGPGCD